MSALSRNVGFLGVGIVGGVLMSAVYFADGCSSTLRFVNTQIACSATYAIRKQGYSAFRDSLNTFITERKEAGEATEVSVYFRDLINGPTMSIDADANFAPASLFKIPYLMTYLKLAEEQSEILEKELAFRIEGEDPNAKQIFKPTQTVQENSPYTIEDLLRRMIVYSDNRSLRILASYLEQISPRADLVYQNAYNMGIITRDGTANEYVTVKSYASIFLLLYHASFLNIEMSEKALAFLAESDFRDGLVAGLPAQVAVAHKFGEYTDQGKGAKQLHDCGIVYYPDNPYLICVMTRGHDYQKLSEIIATVSRLMYEEVDTRRL